MSSRVAVIGENLAAWITALRLQQNGIETTLITLPEVNETSQLPAFLWIGMTDNLERAGQAFGENLAQALWTSSLANYRSADVLLKKIGVKSTIGKLRRFSSDVRECEQFARSAQWSPLYTFIAQSTELPFGTFAASLEEPAMIFSARDLKSAIENKVRRYRADKLITIDGNLTSGLTVRFATGSTVESKKVEAVFLVSERYGEEVSPFLSDKRFARGLTSFATSELLKSDFALGLFNSGQDYLCRDANRTWLGSFRNLHTDYPAPFAVPSERTLMGVRQFFLKGDSTTPLDASLSVESTSCDGLPLVGTLPECPNAWVATAFSGCPLNFMFALSETLVDCLLGRQERDALKIFSTRRFL